MLGASAQPNGGPREEAVVGGGEDDHPRDGGPVDPDRHPERDRFACRSAAFPDQRGHERVVALGQRRDDALPHPHRRSRPDQAHHRILHAGPGTRVARHRHPHLVAHPHVERVGTGHQSHDGVVLGLGRERGGIDKLTPDRKANEDHQKSVESRVAGHSDSSGHGATS